MGLKEGDVVERTVGGIILTGGKAPSEVVLKVAGERSIPLILTRADTFQTMERLEKAKPSLGLKDEFKIHQFLKLIDQEMGTKQWIEALL